MTPVAPAGRAGRAGQAVQKGQTGWAVLVATCLLGPLAVLAAVWWPVVSHYHVATPVVPLAVVERLRTEPQAEVLSRLDEARYGTLPDGSGEGGAAADEVLQGRYRTRNGEQVAVSLEPKPAQISAGSPMAQLQIASLAVPRVLLEGYRQTRDERYFDAALRSALAWARFERSAVLPVGFLWNDHAIAARIIVLTDLWQDYRGRADFAPEQGAELLAFVSRSAALLARDAHYTARTNHGIMQNLALLHVAAAFPGLTGTEGQVALALQRLEGQLPYYVSPDGVVLEHSAGYQDFALRLLQLALEYVDILGVAPPGDLETRFAAARCFRAHFVRPDGSVPAYGDSYSPLPQGAVPASATPAECRGRDAAWIDTDFGYASMHDFAGASAQLFVTWADFASHAHKHDDDLAAWLWLDGRDWWAGSGYWPYGDPSRRMAVSWRGSNAPHAVGEPPAQPRTSRLLGFRSTGDLPFLDLERRSASGATYRRQIVGLGAVGVLVLDAASDGTGAFETVWTLPPGVALREVAAAQPGVQARYDVVDVHGDRALRATLFGGAGYALERLRGSRAPFGGLVAMDGELHPAEALIATADVGAWSGSLWQPLSALGTGAERTPELTPSLTWKNAESWSATLAMPQGVLSVQRAGERLLLRTAQAEPTELPIEAAAQERPVLARATTQYREMAARYPVFRDYFKYRVRASLAVGILFVGQLAGLWALARLRVPLAMRAALTLVAWAATGGWLYYRYLV